MIRVYLVDDHALVRTGFRILLQQFPEFSVVGEAGTGEQALADLRTLEVDVVLCDLHLPGISGLEVTDRLMRGGSSARVVVVSAQQDGPLPRRVLNAGAFGYLGKAAPAEELLRAIRSYQGGPVVRTALALAPMLLQRPNELRGMAWAELDLDAGLWSIAAARMKRSVEGKANGAPHLVPLPRQAIELLRDLHPLTGHTTLVFPGERASTRPISDNTLRAALQTLGYASDVQTVHGFRATGRTILAERLEFDPVLIEAQLAHAVKDTNGRAYNRTSYVEQRRAMMQTWADYLDKLRMGADVIELHSKAA